MEGKMGMNQASECFLKANPRNQKWLFTLIWRPSEVLERHLCLCAAQKSLLAQPEPSSCQAWNVGLASNPLTPISVVFAIYRNSWSGTPVGFEGLLYMELVSSQICQGLPVGFCSLEEFCYLLLTCSDFSLTAGCSYSFSEFFRYCRV